MIAGDWKAVFGAAAWDRFALLVKKSDSQHASWMHAGVDPEA
jgi:hypothetical protein